MCSWCWGYSPVWTALQQNLPDFIQLKYIVGGLAPDSSSPMPIEQQAMIKAHWHSIEKKLGTKFNFDFWRNNLPRRSTYSACRAVIAANNQGYQIPMIEAIQHAYYLRALNPSDNEVLVSLARELSVQELSMQELSMQGPSMQENGEILPFDVSLFINDLGSKETEQALIQQIQLARVLTNQGFPSLVLEHHGLKQQVKLDYKNYQATLTDIRHKIGNI